MLTVTKETTLSNNTANRRLVYTLLESSGPEESPAIASIYGIRTELFSGRAVLDACSIQDITTQRDKALILLELLCRNTVTPCTLRDVIEDFLADDTSEPDAFREWNPTENLMASGTR